MYKMHTCLKLTIWLFLIENVYKAYQKKKGVFVYELSKQEEYLKEFFFF